MVRSVNRGSAPQRASGALEGTRDNGPNAAGGHGDHSDAATAFEQQRWRGEWERLCVPALRRYLGRANAEAAAAGRSARFGVGQRDIGTAFARCVSVSTGEVCCTAQWVDGQTKP